MNMKVFYFFVALYVIFLMFCGIVTAAEEEMVMETDVGEVVLTILPCEVPIAHERYFSFNYFAYATEAGRDEPHLGCWTGADNTIYIHFPELGDVMATYKLGLFHPRPNL